VVAVTKTQGRRGGAQDHITVHGFVDDQRKAEILDRAVVFATCSTHEGWELSGVETNDHGRPAVAYGVPAPRVAIHYDKTGLLAADDEAFRRASSVFLEDTQARYRYSEAAPKMVW